MITILDKIVAHKKEELIVRKIMVPADNVVYSKHFDQRCLSLKESLLKENATGIIAEFKRKSPSKGYINKEADVVKVTTDYTNLGASGLSILTDSHFFGGSTEDITAARENRVPILRKEFIIDPYQIITTKALGADVILLIAAILTPEEVKVFSCSARQLGLEVILEIHNKSELGHICDDVDMIGINNRNLKTFKVDVNHALKLSRLIPDGFPKIAESGIDDPVLIQQFRNEGYHGFLIGETFMKQPDPGLAFGTFINKLK